MNYHLGMDTMRLWGVENSFKHLFSIPFKIRLKPEMLAISSE